MIFQLTSWAENYNVLDVANVVLNNPRFLIWSGSSKPHQHHYGKGGLLQHTFEVVDLCLKNNGHFQNLDKGVDSQKLFLAALFHDSGKMWDYEPVDDKYQDWQGTVHKRRIHHISRSAMVWNETMHDHNFKDEEDEVLHAILAHHGQREWGSPVSPATRLAWLLHLCDNLSARMDDCIKFDRVK